jgi:hypothetical protein
MRNRVPYEVRGCGITIHEDWMRGAAWFFYKVFFFDHLRIFLWESWGEDCFNIVFHKRWERKLPREVVRIGILFYLILAALNNPRDGFLSSEGQHLHFGWWISPFLSIEPWFFWVNQ